MPPEKKEFPERYPEDDGLQFRPHDIPYRNQVRRVLYSGLGRLTKIDGRTVMDLVNQIEDLTWKRFGSTKNRDYYNHIRNINTCLRDFRNTEFNEKILKGTYKPDYVANMPPTKMVSFARQEEAELRKEAFFKDIEGAKEDKPTTDMFKCGKCKKRKCRYYQKQIRSADEPMTTFVTCTYCYHSWKFC
ncbi:hypothetical protein K502DRAFT_304120 [Neoconidiobolus thromboides FSU 785]|nr:hypothetical protein K502DRAFT_304120 [Neoconidiobolus thromboides FSU 785]